MNATLAATTAAHSPQDTTFTEAMNALAPPLREILRLRDVGGLNARTIGAALGIGTPQVHVGLLHARRAVRQRLLNPDGLAAGLVSARS